MPGVCAGPRVRFCVLCVDVCMGLCDLQLPGVHGRVHLCYGVCPDPEAIPACT